MNNDVSVTTELQQHPNLRKLARALIALARHQLEDEAVESEPSHRLPPTGDAA